MSKIQVTQIIKNNEDTFWGFKVFGLGIDGLLYRWDFSEHEWVLA